jgi:hypothetical protein
MLDVQSTPQNSESLRASDPDLPFLASEAAVDIEILLTGGEENLSALRRLTDRLHNSLDFSNEDGTPRSLMDPATLSVLGEAVTETAKNESLRRVEDLISEAVKIFKALSDENLKNNKNELEQARDFCINLSKAAMAYRKSIRDLRPSHPFRR